MAKIEEALREWVRFHGRRISREVLGDLPNQISALKREVRGLRRMVETMQSAVRELSEARLKQMAVPPAPTEGSGKVRFSPKWLKQLRKRLDLTQEELARLLETSTAAVTAWESGRSRPRPAKLGQIVTLRNMKPELVDEALGREHLPARIPPARIKSLRKRHGLTQGELAKLLGVSAAAVGSWESGKTEPSRELRKRLLELAKARRKEVDEMLGRPSGARRAALTAEQIKEIRKKAGLTQKQLAERLGVSPNSVWNWEQGRSAPRRAALEKLLQLAG